MRIVVSGATGYLGGHLISSFLEHGETVLGITRKVNEKLKVLLSEYPTNFSVCELISDDLFLEMQRFEPDVIYSTTCCYETDVRFLEKTVDSNYVFPMQLMKSAIQSNGSGGVKRFINISTSLPSSLNLYSLTKKQFSELGEFYSSMGKIQFVNVLLESFYGTDEPDERFIKRSIKKLLSGQNVDATIGTQNRDYVAINDVTDVLTFLAYSENLKSNYDSIQLGSGSAPTIKEILKFLKDTAGTNSAINFGAVPSRRNEPSTKADLTRLSEIGYTKKMTFWKDGMKKMMEEIKSENFN